MAKTKEEAIADLKEALKFFRHAAAEARATGRFELGILSKTPDGGGKIIASFMADEFFDDIALAIDTPPQTEEDDMDAKAVQLLHTLGLNK